MNPGVEALMLEQSGVVSRKQVLGLGLDDAYIERQLRRREWAKVHRGVYVNHTGELSWLQQTWVAILYYWGRGAWPRARGLLIAMWSISGSLSLSSSTVASAMRKRGTSGRTWSATWPARTRCGDLRPQTVNGSAILGP